MILQSSQGGKGSHHDICLETDLIKTKGARGTVVQDDITPGSRRASLAFPYSTTDQIFVYASKQFKSIVKL